MIRSHLNALLSRIGARRIAAAAMLALLLAAALALAACGGDDAPAAAPEPPPASADPQPAPEPAAAEQPAAAQPPQPVNTAGQDAQADGQQAQPAGAAEQTAPPVATNEYIVQPGDTLAAIANAHDVRLDDLIRINSIQNPNMLRVGQTLLIPSDEPEPQPSVAPAEETEPETQTEPEQEAPVATPTVTLPNTALPLGAPTSTSSAQFPQSRPDAATDRIPQPPETFIQYGADALPWLQGRSGIDEILPIFDAWPMPPLITGNDRINLVDTTGDGLFAAAIVFTDPTSFGARVPFSNLVVYDAIPGPGSRYRIGYDHRLAYGREVQGLQVLSDLDLTGDGIRDITFREVSCSADACANAFYILRSVGDGYRVITGPDALIDNVSQVEIGDGTADGVLDLRVTGQAQDDGQTYSFILSAQNNALTEVSRIPQSE